MRLINIVAALSGALALIMLTIAAHALPFSPEDAERVHLGAFVQLTAAAAGLALANRTGRMSIVAAAMILAGAALFAGVLYGLALTQSRSFVMLAPVGGVTLILGWILAAFAQPSGGT